MSALSRCAIYATLTIACATAAVDRPARAADVSVGNALSASTRPASYDWTGFYFGGHTGVARGTASATASNDVAPIPSRHTFGGPIGGA